MSKKKQLPPEETQENEQVPEEDGAVDARKSAWRSCKASWKPPRSRARNT